MKGGAGRDVFYGGEGVDTLDYSDERVSVVLALTDEPMSVGATVGDIVESVKDIENVFGGSGDDSLTGNSSANALAGGAGLDTADFRQIDGRRGPRGGRGDLITLENIRTPSVARRRGGVRLKSW